MRVRVAASASMPAALALSRAVGITPREALRLLATPRVVPAEFTQEAASGLCAALQQLGVAAEPVNVPPSAGRCDAHPALTTDAQCTRCRKSVCPLCQPLCPPCAASVARAARWKRLRVAVLLVVLGGVAAFAYSKHRAQTSRHSWLRPLRVSVVLVSAAPVTTAERAAWAEGTQRLQQWFSREAARQDVRLDTPVVVTLAPEVVVADAPRPPDATGDWLTDSKAALDFRSQLEALAPDDGTVRVLVALRSRGGHRVEGVGEASGSVGLVEGTLGDTKLTLELLAIAHEVLHLLGARDGYDEHGHALPRGIVEPDRGFPQRFAEVMVGEVPLSATDGRVPEALDEVRLGEVTAKEIGWK